MAAGNPTSSTVKEQMLCASQGWLCALSCRVDWGAAAHSTGQDIQNSSAMPSLPSPAAQPSALYSTTRSPICVLKSDNSCFMCVLCFLSNTLTWDGVLSSGLLTAHVLLIIRAYPQINMKVVYSFCMDLLRILVVPMPGFVNWMCTE
jgi:hypothetical protein